MKHELAKTLTIALVNYIDENRPEGTMDCSSGECVSLEKAFTEESFDSVETLIKKKLSRLTEFQNAVRIMITNALTTHIKDGNGREMSCTVFIDDDTAIILSAELLELAKKELLTDGELAKKYFEGYTKGYGNAEKRYNESVAFHSPIMPTTPIGWGCDGSYCTNPQMDCINCPRKTTGGGFSTSSGTSTSKAEG